GEREWQPEGSLLFSIGCSDGVQRLVAGGVRDPACSIRTNGGESFRHARPLGTATSAQSSKTENCFLVDANLTQQFEVAEHLSRAEHHRSQRIIGNRYRQAGLLANALVEILQQRAAARQDDTAVADVGGKL